MYNCLPMYHSVGGVVATGAMLVSGGSVVIRERFSASRFWDDVVDGTARCSSISASCAATSSTARRIRARRAHRLRLCCGNGLQADVWEAFQRRFRHPADPGILRRDRRQLLALQLRGQARRDRPHPAVPRAPLSGGAGPVRRRDRRAAARRRRASASAAPPTRPARRSAGSPTTATAAARPVRGLYRRGGVGTQDPARRVRAGRRWFRTGDLMRKDAARLFLLRRPHRRHVPLEGRERLDHRGRGGDRGVSRRRSRRSSTAWRSPAPRAAPAWPRIVAERRLRPRRAAAASRRALAGLCAPAVPAHPRRDRRSPATFKPKKQDWSREGYDPALTADRDLFQRPRSTQAFVRLDAALLRAHPERLRSDGCRSTRPLRPCCRHRRSAPCR